MTTAEVLDRIKKALDAAPRNAYTSELHVQIIKYAAELDRLTGKEFCEGLGIGPSFGAEFAKMRKIAPRLIAANLNVNLI